MIPYGILFAIIGLLGVVLSFSDFVGEMGWILRLLSGLGLVVAVMVLVWRSSIPKA